MAAETFCCTLYGKVDVLALVQGGFWLRYWTGRGGLTEGLGECRCSGGSRVFCGRALLLCGWWRQFCAFALPWADGCLALLDCASLRCGQSGLCACKLRTEHGTVPGLVLFGKLLEDMVASGVSTVWCQWKIRV